MHEVCFGHGRMVSDGNAEVVDIGRAVPMETLECIKFANAIYMKQKNSSIASSHYSIASSHSTIASSLATKCVIPAYSSMNETTEIDI